LVESALEIREAIEKGKIGFPFVQKVRKGGYDGRGVAVVNTAEDISRLLEGPSVVEVKVDIVKEIAVIAARNRKGEIRCYPVVEMLFDPQANLVDKLICPSSVTVEQSEKAIGIASELIELLNMEGVLAVEFFINTAGEVIVNEVAPRTHNSGHHTIESIITSQFEQTLSLKNFNCTNTVWNTSTSNLPKSMVHGIARNGGLHFMISIEHAKPSHECFPTR